MLRSSIRVALLSVAALGALPGLPLASPGAAAPASRPVITVVLPPGGEPEAKRMAEWQSGGFYAAPDLLPALAGLGEAAASAGVDKRGVPGLATFHNTVSIGRKRYPYTMVGTDPSVRKARNATIKMQIIPVRFEFADGTVLDPTQPNSCLTGSPVPLDLVLQSPLFQFVDYGTDGVPRQFVEEIRREEFWHFTAPGALNPGYSVRVAASAPATLRVVMPASYLTTATHCGRGAMVTVDTWNQILTQITPQLRSFGISPQTFPMFMVLNVETTFGSDGVAAGFHTASGGQTLGVAMWDATALFPRFPDISIMSHELAEWYDDPFVNNATPPWGNVGQVSGCQANLEVGDPLTGSLFGDLAMPNGFDYHPQETAFFSWFFDQVPSLGIDGRYSSAGTFTAPASPCP